MTKSNERTHPYIIPLPTEVYQAYKIRAVKNHTTLKHELLESLEKDLLCPLTSKNIEPVPELFREEWESEEDEEAFAHLQKYKK